MRPLVGHDDGRDVAGPLLRGRRGRLPKQPDLLGGLHPTALRLHPLGTHDPGTRSKFQFLNRHSLRKGY